VENDAEAPMRASIYGALAAFHDVNQTSTGSDTMLSDIEDPEWLSGGIVYIESSRFVLPDGKSLDICKLVGARIGPKMAREAVEAGLA